MIISSSIGLHYWIECSFIQLDYSNSLNIYVFACIDPSCQYLYQRFGHSRLASVQRSSPIFNESQYQYLFLFYLFHLYLLAFLSSQYPNGTAFVVGTSGLMNALHDVSSLLSHLIYSFNWYDHHSSLLFNTSSSSSSSLSSSSFCRLAMWWMI